MTTNPPPLQPAAPQIADYVDQELAFLPDRIVVKATGDQVMMAWEAPLMQAMAQAVATRPGDILEVGFGMGLSATEIQRLAPRSHTIIEAHPQIATRAHRWAQDRRAVRILSGRWQEHVESLDTYDGILFDVFGGKGQRRAFFSHLGQLLRPRGYATYWIGDDREVEADVRSVLSRQGFGYRFRRVSAVPTKDCTYSRNNELYFPVIQRIVPVIEAS